MGIIKELPKLRNPKPHAEVFIDNNGLHDFLNHIENPKGRLKLKPLAKLQGRVYDPAVVIP